MEIRFSIIITFDTPMGKKSFGSFELGIERETASEIFNSLSGNIAHGNSRYICMEINEEIGGLPVPLGIQHCTLEELKENIAIITKEIFKMHHMEKK